MTVSASTPTTKSRVLIAGATGFIGQFVASASLDSGRQTYVLVRPGLAGCLSKSKVLKSLHDKGAIILHGSISDRENMAKILKDHEIDIVISAVGGANVLDQIGLVEAIKAVGTIKRFLPSEFGHDVVRAVPVEPGEQMYKDKRVIRQLVEKYSIPYNYICCNSIASWPYYDNKHPANVLPPLDHFKIYGDGTVKAYFVAGTDIGKFTMKIVDDVRAINKSVHFRPSSNFYNMNELASLWEKKIGRTLPRATVTEQDLLDIAAENIIPESIVASFTHDIFIKGCQSNFSINGPDDIEVGTLYPDEAFRTVDECFNDFALELKDTAMDLGSKANAAPNHAVESMALSAPCALSV
ncbi:LEUCANTHOCYANIDIN REDUCTASE [Salix koriyanagi]|uniref:LEUCANTHOCYANIDIN REDUCTASE n=1 Tax=Salix koriyanagi TaxID=2511006 RepID=A0A9Q1AEY7_9ROSI|nr:LEUCANTHOCYANIDIN REDUCTASE [Salix koriyanagi]